MEIFKSKRFWSAGLGVIFMGLVHFVPQLQADEALLTQAILVVVGLLIGGYSLEDSVQAYKAK